jgi:uncharacterized protein YbbC (DUF1343 family)
MKTVKCGIDRIEEDSSILKGMRIGLITNPTGVDKDLKSTIDILKGMGELVCLFAPEHGVRGDVQAGLPIADDVDERTGVKVYSLYGDRKKPTESMLRDVDALVFDIQDVGARYYTYLYTMSYGMEAAREFGRKFIVLDRPNPLGGIVTEGAVLDPAFSSFVGRYSIPARYGLTVGESARLINCEFGIGCNLEVVELAGWERNMYFDDTGLDFIAPSPNIPTADTALLYAGACLFEGTNVSEGRGTTQPFQLVGAPWIDGYKLAQDLNQMNLKGVRFRPACFTPAFSKHRGLLCKGVQMHVRDRNNMEPLKVAVAILSNLARDYKEFEFLPNNKEGTKFDRLAGTDALRESIRNGSTEEFLNGVEIQLAEFEEIRQKYIIY